MELTTFLGKRIAQTVYAFPLWETLFIRVVPKMAGNIVPVDGSKGGVAAGGQNVSINIRNESNQKVEAKSARTSFDAQGMVLDIVIDGINRNVRGMRDMMGR